MSHVLQSRKTRMEAITPLRRELPNTSTVHVPLIITSLEEVLFRCRLAAIRHNIHKWVFRPIRAIWEHPIRDHPDPDIPEHHTRRHPIRTLEHTECNPVILHNVRMITLVECTTVSDLRG